MSSTPLSTRSSPNSSANLQLMKAHFVYPVHQVSAGYNIVLARDIAIALRPSIPRSPKFEPTPLPTSVSPRMPATWATRLKTTSSAWLTPQTFPTTIKHNPRPQATATPRLIPHPYSPHSRLPSTPHVSVWSTWTPTLLAVLQTQQPRRTEVPTTGDTPQEGPEIELFIEPCQLQGSTGHQEPSRRNNPAHSQRRQDLSPTVA